MFLSNRTEGTLPLGVLVDSEYVVRRGVKLIIAHYVLGGLAQVHILDNQIGRHTRIFTQRRSTGDKPRAGDHERAA